MKNGAGEQEEEEEEWSLRGDEEEKKLKIPLLVSYGHALRRSRKI